MTTIIDHIDPDKPNFRPLVRKLVKALRETEKNEILHVNQFLMNKLSVVPSSRIRIYLRQLEQEGFLTLDTRPGEGWKMVAEQKIRQLEV